MLHTQERAQSDKYIILLLSFSKTAIYRREKSVLCEILKLNQTKTTLDDTKNVLMY